MGLLDEIKTKEVAIEPTEDVFEEVEAVTETDDFGDVINEATTEELLDDEDVEDEIIETVNPTVENTVKVFDRDQEVEKPLYTKKTFIITGNVLGHKKGSIFSGSKSQIEQLLEFKVIKALDKMTREEKVLLGVN